LSKNEPRVLINCSYKTKKCNCK